jgi:hypothetical protein
MSKIIIERALLSDNSAICELCQIPMVGDISLTMERDPDYFINAGIQNQEVEIYVCRQQNRIVGVFSIGKRTVFFDGSPRQLRYFSDLRIHPEFQKSMLLVRMSRFLKTNKIIQENEISHAVIFSENKTMTDLIEKVDDHFLKKASLLKFSLYGDYCSYMISLSKQRKKKKSNLHIRKAESKDIETMQLFFNKEAPSKQLYPCYNFSCLDDSYYYGLKINDFYLAFEKEKLVGITGVWDQRKFKQTKIYSYSGSIKFVRPLLNIASKITKGFILPEPGEKLNYFMLHTILTQNNEPKIFKDLLEKIYADNYLSEFSYFLCGLDKNDGLCHVFKDFTKRIVKGGVYSVSFDTEIGRGNSISPNFYLETARI